MKRVRGTALLSKCSHAGLILSEGKTCLDVSWRCCVRSWQVNKSWAHAGLLMILARASCREPKGQAEDRRRMMPFRACYSRWCTRVQHVFWSSTACLFAIRNLSRAESAHLWRSTEFNGIYSRHLTRKESVSIDLITVHGENLVVIDDTIRDASFDIELVDVPILATSRDGQVRVMARQRSRVEVEMQ